jgi:regulator of sigma E protease
MVNVIYAIIALSILIFVHELGHFLVARLANVKVLKFSLGFGPKLFGFTRGETEYVLSSVPLGGYVKLLGESPDDKVPEEEADRAYTNKPPFIRILIAFTGPLFNILFAGLLFFVIFASGYSVLSTKVGSVEKGYPAEEAGIQEGDLITSVDGKPVNEWSDLMDAMAKADVKPLTFGIERDGRHFEKVIIPKETDSKNLFGETTKRKVIGVTASNSFIERRESPLGALSRAITQTYSLSEMTVVGVVKLIKGSISPKNIGGPILILQTAGKTAKEGKKNFIYFVAIISINLGVVNLLPIPILDGGHIFFYLLELVARRRIPLKTVEISQKIGMAVLILIMILAFVNDIVRIFNGS